MSACPLCGGDVAAPVSARWALDLPMEPPSQNELKSNHGSSRHVYRRMREDFELMIRSEMARQRIPKAKGVRRIKITRLMGKGKRAFDHANLVGGCKPLVDACVRAGLLVDDGPAYFKGYYWQRRNRQEPGTLLEVEEF